MRVFRVLSFAALAAVTLASFAAPGAAQIPTPESVLGYAVGADFELANYEQSLDYFHRLDAASDRLMLQEVGVTSFGRPWYVAIISSEDNLRDVERYRDLIGRLGLRR